MPKKAAASLLLKELSKFSPAGRALIMNVACTGVRDGLRPRALPVYFEGHQLRSVWHAGHELHCLHNMNLPAAAVPAQDFPNVERFEDQGRELEA